MSRDKQISEMRYLADEMGKAISTEIEMHRIADERKLEAVLKENGWRKSTDVAEEIIGEVISKAKAIFCPDCDYDVADIRYALDWLEAELKKKYIGEDTNVTTNTEGER